MLPANTASTADDGKKNTCIVVVFTHYNILQILSPKSGDNFVKKPRKSLMLHGLMIKVKV